jgi:hypothetical protein
VDGGVEYTNTDNRAQSNDVTLATGQTVGVVRVQGTTSGNGFEANRYLVPSVLEDYFRWWDGVQARLVGWSGWQGFGQDLTGSLSSSAAAPTITTFSPTRGHTGITVTLLGLNLAGTALVSFAGASARFRVDSDTQISATVPAAATTGPIEVTSPGGTATSVEDFTVVPRMHRRTVSLRLRGALRAEGHVGVRDGFPACKRGTPVEIQRWVDGRWRTIATRRTGERAAYRLRLPDRPGRYRARLSTWDPSSADTCGAAVSKPVSHP